MATSTTTRTCVATQISFSFVPEEIRRIEGDVERRFRDLHTRVQNKRALHGSDAAQGASIQGPPCFSVGSFRVMHEVLIPVGRARNFMAGLLGTRDNDRLKAVFGDCDVIANIRAMTEQIQELLRGTQHGKDARLRDCLDACTSVEQVLISVFRLDRKLQAAQAKAKHRTQLTLERRVELLREIDEAEDDNIEGAIDELFRHYDVSGDGALSGAAYEEVVDLVCGYVAQESQERAQRLGLPKLAQTPVQVRDHIKDWLDPNKDGSITKAEAIEGLKKAVDDIDPVRKDATLPLEQKSDPMRLLELIDEGDDPDSAISKLFAHFDPSGSGVLSGSAHEEFIHLVSEYVANESRERAKRLKRPSLEMVADKILPYIRAWLDPDNDGVITLAEARVGLVKAVNDIDPRAEVERKKAALLANARSRTVVQ